MKQKKRYLQSEKKWIILIDALVLICISTLLFFALQNRIYVGVKSFAASSGIFVFSMLMFMAWLDEYKTFVTEMYEQTVIFILSSIYAFCILAVIDICVLQEIKMLRLHFYFPVFCALGLFVENWAIHKILTNPNWFQKPKLLIIETDSANFKRMRRIKYGTLHCYDSWYEALDINDPNALEQLMNKKLKGYDAVCLLDRVSGQVYNRVVEYAMGHNMELFIVPKMSYIGRSRAELSRFDDVLVLNIPKYTIGSANEFLKRITDIAFAALGLILAAIPMALIALWIKVDSPGDVFYKQIRLTKGKREFYIYKFRTMVQNAEAASGPVMAQKSDSRITRAGKILRACRLDELPQLYNILKGDMSVVGPRPERPFFVEQFEKEFEDYSFRFAVKAGLTGYAHVYGKYSTYTYDRTCFDLTYIANYSYLLDIKIMLLTSKIMFLKSAAEGEDEFKSADNNGQTAKEDISHEGTTNQTTAPLV